MLEKVIEGFGLGLSLGLGCLVACGPVYLTFVLRKSTSFRTSAVLFAKILAGRFAGYALFGLFAGMLGIILPDSFRLPLTNTAFIVLGALLVYTGISRKTDTACATKSFGAYFGRFAGNPYVIGFLTGLELCPPFVLAIARVINFGGAIEGMVYFLGFFVASSAFLVPLVFFGVAAEYKTVKHIAAAAAIIVGCWFVYKGAGGFYEFISTHNEIEAVDYAVVGVPDAPQVFIFSGNASADELVDCLKPHAQGSLANISPAKFDSALKVLDTLGMIIVDGAQLFDTKHAANKYAVIVIENGIATDSTGKLCEFLRTYHFKKRFGHGFVFKM